MIFFLFAFNNDYCYLIIIFCLQVGNIVILNRFSLLIHVFFAASGYYPEVSILHFLYKSTFIFYNNISL